MAYGPTYDNIKPISLAVGINCRSREFSATQVFRYDSYGKNVFIEQDGQEAYAVKRPGLALVADLVTGFGLTPPVPLVLPNYICQGAFRANGFDCVVYSDNVVAFNGNQFNTDQTASVFPIPAGNPPGSLYRGIPVQGALCITQGPVSLARITPTVAIVTSNVVPLVPSLCELDGTYYILDREGTIWASDFMQPLVWPALNFVQALPGNDSVVLWKHLTYLLAFSASQLKVYYNAGISPGAPIAQVMNAGGKTGIPESGALTIQTIDEVTYWLGRSETAGYIVYQMLGLTVSKISTPAVERMLTYFFGVFEAVNAGQPAGSTTVVMTASVFREAGHSFYLLSCPSIPAILFNGITLAYDITTKHWAFWSQVNTSLVEAEVRIVEALPESGRAKSICPDVSDGKLFMVDEETFEDAGQTINCLIQTNNMDWGNPRTKMVPATYLHVDTEVSSVSVSWTNDDFVTFTVPVVLSTAITKKQIIRCGSTIDRAWRVAHSDDTPMRFYQIQLELQPGAL